MTESLIAKSSGETLQPRDPILGAGARVIVLALLLFYLIFAVWASVTLPKWLDVANHPVQFRLVAPADTVIELCWRKGERCLPMIPDKNSVSALEDATGERIASLWLGELPPEIHYDVSIRFPDGVENAQFISFLAINTNELRAASREATSVALKIDRLTNTAQLNATGLVLHSAAIAQTDGTRTEKFNAEPGATVQILSDVKSYTRMDIGPLRIFVIFLLPVVLTVGLFVCIVKTREFIVPVPKPSRMQWFWVGAITGGVLHLVLAQSGAFFYHPNADSRVYLGQAFSLYTSGTLHVPGMSTWEALVRTPGYSTLLAFWMLFVGAKNFSVLMLLQALMTITSMTALGYSLRGRAPDWALGLAVFIPLLLPLHIWSSLAMSSDGPYVAFALIALACWFERLQHALPERNRWMWLYLLFACCAISIRPTGVILLVPLILRTLGCLYLWRFKESHSGRRELKYQFAAYIIVLAVLGAWSLRNVVMYSYGGVTSYTDLVVLAGKIENGIFDIRSLKHPKVYHAYLQGRFDVKYAQYHIQITGPLSEAAGSDHPSRLNPALREIWSRSAELTPLTVELVGALRNFWFATYIPGVHNHGGARSSFGMRSPEVEPKFAERVVKALNDIVPGAVYDIRRNSPLWSLYLHVSGYELAEYDPRIHSTAWILVLIVSAVVFFSLLIRGNAEMAGLLLIFAANIVLLCMVGLVFDRYVLIFSPLVFLQIACARELWQTRE